MGEQVYSLMNTEARKYSSSTSAIATLRLIHQIVLWILPFALVIPLPRTVSSLGWPAFATFPFVGLQIEGIPVERVPQSCPPNHSGTG
jgi:hypothetical protein